MENMRSHTVKQYIQLTVTFIRGNKVWLEHDFTPILDLVILLYYDHISCFSILRTFTSLVRDLSRFKARVLLCYRVKELIT